MIHLEDLKEEMIGLQDSIEYKEIDSLEDFVESLDDSIPFKTQLDKLIEKTDTLLKDSKDLFTKNVCTKWRNELKNMYNLPGLWKKNGEYISFEELIKHKLIKIKNNYLYEVSESLDGTFIIKDDLIGISSYCFSDCNKITEIIIPNTIMNIEESAFQYCSSLTSIKLPKKETDFDVGWFYGCNNLRKIETNAKFIKGAKELVLKDLKDATNIDIELISRED